MYKDPEKVLATQGLRLEGKKPFYRVSKPFISYSQLQENTENQHEKKNLNFEKESFSK